MMKIYKEISALVISENILAAPPASRAARADDLEAWPRLPLSFEIVVAAGEALSCWCSIYVCVCG